MILFWFKGVKLAKFARLNWARSILNYLFKPKNLQACLRWLIQSWEMVAKSTLQPNPLWAQKKERNSKIRDFKATKWLQLSKGKKHLSPSISKMSNPNVSNITWTSYGLPIISFMYVFFIPKVQWRNMFIFFIPKVQWPKKYNRFNRGMSEVNNFIIPKNRINDQTIQLIFATLSSYGKTIW